MDLYEQGIEYWNIARRFHQNRDKSTVIKPTAVRDMQRLQQKTRSPAVLKRINGFLSKHRVVHTGGGGPRVA